MALETGPCMRLGKGNRPVLQEDVASQGDLGIPLGPWIRSFSFSVPLPLGLGASSGQDPAQGSSGRQIRRHF